MIQYILYTIYTLYILYHEVNYDNQDLSLHSGDKP